MRLNAPIRIIDTANYATGWLSRLAGFRCPHCGTLLPVWVAMKTMRPRKTIDAIRCSDCNNHLIPVLWFGIGLTSFFAITLPIFVLMMSIFVPAIRGLNWLTYFHPTRGAGEPNALAMIIAFTCAAGLTVILTAVVQGRLSRVEIDNDWKQS